MCDSVFTTAMSLTRHVQTVQQQVQSQVQSFSCPLCLARFSRKEHLVCHQQNGSRCERQPVASTSSAPSPPPIPSTSAAPSPPPLPHSAKKTKTEARGCVEEEEEDELLTQLPADVEEVYRRHWSSVRTHKRCGKQMSVFTYLWAPHAPPPWSQRLNDLFDSQTKCFKINFAHSFLLRHRKTNELLFVHASDNSDCALERPILICNKPEFLSFISEVQSHDAVEHALNERPHSKYVVVAIMSTSFYVYPLNDFPIG